ncbi:MAG: hypothetical protein ACKVQT_15505 [Burkholderiales bacterium]
MKITDGIPHQLNRLNEEAVVEARGRAMQGFRAIKMTIGVGSLKRDLDRDQVF